MFRRADGAWLVELGAVLRRVVDRAWLELEGATWLLLLPGELGTVPETLKSDGSPLGLGDVELCFAPSLDEEYVDVRVRFDGGTESMLAPRSSHYVLLTLARARLADARDGIVPASKAGSTRPTSHTDCSTRPNVSPRDLRGVRCSRR